MGRTAKPAETRFWEHVDKKGDDDCWQWTGRIEPNGYARFRPSPDISHPRKGAHVFSFALASGRSVTPGMTIDHLCHDPATCSAGFKCPHRSCVNPRHLAEVSYAFNVLRGNGTGARNARKVNCQRGHPLNGDNLFINANGARVCITCRRENDSARRNRS